MPRLPSSAKSFAPRVHFIGIGGIGMSGLARYFKSLKRAVSGSDAVKSPMTDELKKGGINVKIGHKTGNLPPPRTKSGGLGAMVVYNRAIRPDNPEFKAALARKDLVTLPYSQALGRITEQYRTIAISGSHGKSTTTALAGVILMRAGLDPTILVGTRLADLGGKNIRLGHGPFLVLEADDYGAAFLDYSPAVAIVTNIDREHMDFYKTEANVKRAFLKFLSRTREGGALILNRDDAPLYSLRAQVARLAKKKKLKVIWFSVRGIRGATDAAKIRKAIPIPGAHNVSNASAVMALGKLLKISEKNILSAIGAYRGAWRRMEYKGKFQRTVQVFDDYAHHPSEIKATLAAFREKFPQSPLICVFQPHQAKRLEVLFDEFMAAFDGADVVFILPLYQVLGRDEKLPRDSESLVRAIEKRAAGNGEPGKPIFYLRDPKKIRAAVRASLRDVPLLRDPRFTKPPGVIMMGAGDIADLTHTLLQ
jgi:UDP-N-acetylmuramate--alanine ligase